MSLEVNIEKKLDGFTLRAAFSAGNTPTALLGASGCGKSMTLRCIAGIVKPDKGRIVLDGRVLFDSEQHIDLPPQQRGAGLLFQNYALFPHMKVWENIAYGLKMRGATKEEQLQTADRLMELLFITHIKNQYPGVLSGGESQRTALARALAVKPDTLLLDEPFAAIDAKVRTELRTWLRSMVTRLGITSIFVTHDQDEAVEVADEIIITNHGKIEQMGSPIEIYKSPATPFVVEFIGKASEVNDYSKLKGFDEIQGAKRAIIRPEFVKLSKYGKLQQYNSAAEEGCVEDILFRGNHLDVTVNIGGTMITGEWSLEKEPLQVGEKVHVLIYRIYAVDDEKTYLCENKGMRDDDVFYI